MKIEIPKFLYHYTSIDTLEKIILNKNIRFNRLDKVNDNNEGKSLDFGDLGIYIFVSCWTDTLEENPSLWKIYSNNYSGVRIKFPTEMFKYYTIESEPEKAFFVDPNTKYPKQREFIHGQDYIMSPIPIDFPSKVVYTDELRKIIPKVGNTYDSNLIHMGKLGAFKEKKWAHENEWRFKLRIMPAPPPPKKTYLEYKDNFHLLVQEQFIKRKVSIKNIYLDINEKALEQMEITFGANCTAESYEKVLYFLGKNNIDCIINESSLKTN